MKLTPNLLRESLVCQKFRNWTRVFPDSLKALLEVLPKEQLWINPDCGLKTRKWPEVKQSLINMVEAVNIIKKAEKH